MIHSTLSSICCVTTLFYYTVSQKTNQLM